MRTIRPQSKPADVTIEHIEENIQELQRRFDRAVNPTYHLMDYLDPQSHRVVNLELNRYEWWTEWKRTERTNPMILRHPFKRLGELRASTDDHAFNEGAKVIEDLLQQVSLLRQVIMLHKKQVNKIPRGPPPMKTAKPLPRLPALPPEEEEKEEDDAPGDPGYDQDDTGDDGDEEGQYDELPSFGDEETEEDGQADDDGEPDDAEEEPTSSGLEDDSDDPEM